MPKLVQPQVFMLAQTKLDHLGVEEYLKFLEVPGWDTYAASAAEKLVEIAGKTCYLSFSTDLNKNLTKVGTRTNEQYIQDGLIAQKHGSVLEHATVTFALCNVSRVFTHELVRHRVGTAYSQVSGRYVRSDVIALWLPKVIRENETATKIFLEAFTYMEKAVARLEALFEMHLMKDAKSFGLKKILTSALRRLIGNGQANHIIFTANHRTLRHLVEVRTSRHAEEEIRLVFSLIWEHLLLKFPSIYKDGGVTLVEGIPEVVFFHSKV